MRPATGLLLLVVATTPLCAQSDYREFLPGRTLLNLFALELGVGAAPMQSIEATPILDLSAAPNGSAAQRWQIHFAPSGSPAAEAAFRLVERRSGLAAAFEYSSAGPWTTLQYGLRIARTVPLGTSRLSLGGALGIGAVQSWVDAERSVTTGDGEVTSSRGIRSPSDSTYTFTSRALSTEASTVLRWTPSAGEYLFLEVGYRMAHDLGDWRVQMRDVPLELRSATWETAPPTMRTRGAVVRIGFGAFVPAT